MFIRQQIKIFSGLFLRRKALNHLNSRHIFMDKGVQIGRFLSEQLPSLVGNRHDRKQSCCQEGQGNQGGQRQAGIFYHHDHGHSHHGDKFRYQLSNTVREQFFQRVYIPDDSCQDFSGRSAVKEMKAQGLNMRIQFFPDREQHLVRDSGHQNSLYPGSQHKGQVSCQYHSSQHKQPLPVSVCHMYIDRPLNKKRGDQTDGHGQSQQQGHQEKLLFVGKQIAVKPLQRLLF